MSILQELESIMGVTLPAPFNYIIACIVMMFLFGTAFNFIKLIFRLFIRN